MNEKTGHFYCFGPFRLDSRECLLVLEGKPVPLAPKAFEVLLVLVENAGHLVDKDDLMKRLWPGTFVEEANVAKHVSLLRRILSEATNGREYIETVPKRGYRFVVEVKKVAEPEAGSQPQATPGANLTGKKVSHYRVLEVLGGGGMGVVYKAEDLKLGRFVALKFLPEEIASEAKVLERFEREARAASALDHPNICAIHEFGEYDGRPFIAMSLLQGQNLRERIVARAAPFTTDELLNLAIQIGEGLAAAHERGIIHRDIKPANIFITNRNEAKILDFGLAKMTDAGDREGLQCHEAQSQDATTAMALDIRLSLTGVTMGTVPYMSPEQVRGEKLDARTDLFSFGLVLYEMATGQQAFSAGTAAGLHEAILSRTAVSARELNPELPPKVEEIINKALEKDRNLRYQHAADMRTDLQRLKRDSESGRSSAAISGLVVVPDSPHTRFKKLWKTAVLVLLIAVLVAGGSYYRSHQNKRLTEKDTIVLTDFANSTGDANPRRSHSPVNSAAQKRVMLAVLPFQNMSNDPAQEYFSDGLTEETITDLGQLSPEHLGVIARTSAMAYKHTNKTITQIGHELDVDYVLEGSVRREGGEARVSAQLIRVSDQTHLWAQNYERELHDLLQIENELGKAIARQVQINLTPQQEIDLSKMRTINPDAYDLYLKGRYYWNLRNPAAIKESIGYFQQATAQDPNFALAYVGLADAYNIGNILGVYSAKDSLPKAKAAATKALALDPSLAEAHAALGMVKSHYDFDFSGAEREFLKAIELNPNSAYAHFFYSNCYLAPMGRMSEAIAENKKAVELDPLSLPINNFMGMTYLFAEDYEKSYLQFRHTIAMDPTFPLAHLYFSWLLTTMGKYEEGIKENEKSEVLSGASSEDATAEANAMLQAFKTGGERGFWQKNLERALQTQKRPGGGFVAPTDMAAAYALAGDKDSAFEWLDKAYAERDGEGITLLKVVPAFKSLRGDPRFTDLLRRLGLPE
jgi:serine/threonine protein kinase/tetratricopeptide (TPR) repeat protein